MSITLSSLGFFLYNLGESVAVVDAGEGIVSCHVIGLLLGESLLGDILQATFET